MKRYVDARGKQCPIPVVETRKALELMGEGDEVETLVDNEIAVQNLLKMAKQKKVAAQAEQYGEDEYRVSFSRTEESLSGEESREKAKGKEESQEKTFPAEKVQPKELNWQEKTNRQEDAQKEEKAQKKETGSRKDRVVVAISSDKMGQGDDALGEILMKGFLYALTGLPVPPTAVLLYNGGARLSVEGSGALPDLRRLENLGTEILTCGTCLNFYGLTDKLSVGKITDMYTICEKLTEADKVVRP